MICASTVHPYRRDKGIMSLRLRKCDAMNSHMNVKKMKTPGLQASVISLNWLLGSHMLGLEYNS